MGSEKLRILLPWDVAHLVLAGDTQNAAGLLASQRRWPFKAAVECILEWKMLQADLAADAIEAANENAAAPV